MSLQTISAIKDAEKQAEEIIKKAQQKAQEIVKEAQDTSYAEAANSMHNFGVEAEQIIKAAEEKAKVSAQQIKQDYEKQCNEIAISSKANMNKAVEFIMKRIENV